MQNEDERLPGRHITECQTRLYMKLVGPTCRCLPRLKPGLARTQPAWLVFLAEHDVHIGTIEGPPGRGLGPQRPEVH